MRMANATNDHNESALLNEQRIGEEQENMEERDYDHTMRVFSIEQLAPLDMLKVPIWIFDYTGNRKMRWANQTALVLFNSPSLQELQTRDFSQISTAAVKRMQDFLSQIRRGKYPPVDQWTMYPKGEAKTVHMNVSGIRFPDDDHYSIFCEGLAVVHKDLIEENLRAVEMLRHLPMAVCQFDMKGQVLFQNPEASMEKVLFHQHPDNGNESNDSDRKDSTKAPCCKKPRKCLSVRENLLDRFIESNVGRESLQKLQSPSCFELELQANMHTRHGPQWSSIQLRKVNDPLTSEPVILYSALDKTDAVDAQNERHQREQTNKFFAIMAHEIRTPLHQVSGFIDLLDQTTLNLEQKSFVKIIKSSAKGLMTVISNVLDYKKLETGELKLERFAYEPLSVLQGSFDAVKADCEEKNIYLKLQWNQDIPIKILGDPNRLRQVLLNLLSNAVKFTEQGGIHVQAFLLGPTPTPSQDNKDNGDDDKTMIKIVVSDTGMGISRAETNCIFAKYQQANESVARNYGGAGIGLSICRTLVRTMGGQIGVDSEPGRGASFWFTLPVNPPHEVDSNETNEDEQIHLQNQRSLQILVAEDNLVNRKLVKKILERMGHSVLLVNNGKEAIECIQKKLPDAVLMDIQMPVMDGLEATRRLRSMGFTQLPIFGLTASVARSNFAELGFNAWIPKPVPLEELRAQLSLI